MRKTQRTILVLIVLFLICIPIYLGLYIFSIFLLVSGYLAYEVMASDNINYDVRKDHDYKIINSNSSEHVLHKNMLSIPEGIDSSFTVFLEMTCQAEISGYLFDPFIEINCAGRTTKQYFERGFKGKRYLNISHLPLSQSSQITLFSQHCRFTSNDCRIISMKNDDVSTKNILIIAPHADDAEISSFGLYSSNNSMIVTITAGESEPDCNHISMTKDRETASILKGKLRSWDSISTPLWAGLNSNRAINLGYSDNILEKLHSNKEKQYPSKTKKIFRQFNSINLRSDDKESSSWQLLVDDLSEIIDLFNPEIIVTPHPEIDSHSDHKLSTKAVKEAVGRSQSQHKLTYFYYMNHLSNTDRWPFGPHNSLIAPPPGTYQVEGFYSHPVDNSTQINKAYSLEMMHDLRKEPKIKHKVRYWLQKILIRRAIHPLGKNPYFQKSIRENELFITKTE